ncbi:MAG: PAS domain S-box protein, partial [Chloroflexi bacterium]|nr:PAS domain S-box protein [Chloroflexota bacterium]
MSTIIKQTTTDTKRYEQELEESRNRLTGIIASAMDAIISIDEDQKIILFNSAAEKVFGYTSDTIMGKSLDVLIPQRFRSPHHNHIQHFGQTGVTNRDMGRLGTLFGIRSNGEEFQIEASISQVQAGRGRIFTVILRDVTARVENERKLIENEQQLRATFEQAAIGIAHQSLQGQWLRVNPGFCGITGYTSDELLTKIAREISHPDDVRRDDELKEQLLRREIPTYSLEKRFIKKDGTIIWVNQTISLVLDRHGEPLYLINVIEDITARKNAETALQARTDEIKTMTQQLWQTAKLATMGELAASIAHELNNPLAILSLRIESLVANPAYTNGDMRELQIMQHEIERMAYLVSNL